MPVKESSDELNAPLVGVDQSIVRAGRARSAGDYAALGLATWGVGFLPLAPGTWGSLLGVALYLLLRAASLGLVGSAAGASSAIDAGAESFYATLLLAAITLLTFGGVWAATRVERLLGRKDPGVVVVDEVAGQLVAFLFVPLSISFNWWTIAAAFLFFRLFDIWKPYPARRLEALESGLGIMADDLVAGVYAAACTSLLVTLSLML